jgi:hypothetical protein
MHKLADSYMVALACASALFFVGGLKFPEDISSSPLSCGLPQSPSRHGLSYVWQTRETLEESADDGPAVVRILKHRQTLSADHNAAFLFFAARNLQG